MTNTYLSFLDILTHAIVLINEHGYLTKDNSYIYDTKSTADRIKESLYSIDINDEVTTEAINIIDWIKQQDKSKFNESLISLIDEGVKSASTFGIIASTVNNFRLAQAIKIKEKTLNANDFATIDDSIIMTRQKEVVTYINNYKPIHFKGNLMNFISEDSHHLICYRKKGFKTSKGKEYNLNGIYEKIIQFGKFKPVIVKHYKLT